MEKANKKIIVIALFLSLITAVLVYVYITGTKTAAPEIEYATVYVAAKTMPARYEITAADLRQVKIAKELLNPNAIKDIVEITGKRTKERIIEGELILNERLADKNNMSLSYILPQDSRAVSINVNEQINVSNLLRPGDFIDVVASFEKEEDDDGQTKKYYPRMTKTILQNVQVLALGQDSTLPPDKLKELPTTVTLAVKIEDIEKFVFASEYGTLRLVLRPLDDINVLPSQGIIRGDMTGAKGVYLRPSNE